MAPASEPDASGDGLLPCIAPIVVANCALGECHDSVTKQHGMDLSTGERIYESWIDRSGLDHCSNSVQKRVVPGDPEASYVMAKITGSLPCINELSQPMPPPPRAQLTPDQIEAIRTWIAAGARLDCSVLEPTDASADVSSDAEPEASTDGTGGTSARDATIDVRPDRIVDSFECTTDDPCGSNEVCVGNGCHEVWECFSHFYEPVLEHPCPEETQLYCGCDGVTFEAQSTCPDRPYLHPGACGDGVSCDDYDVACDSPAPDCPDGQLPSIVDGCYGECVPLASCRCEYTWECPGYQCIGSETRCGPLDDLDAGDADP